MAGVCADRATALRERFGLAFEELGVGLRFQHRPGLTLSQQDNRDEGLDTLNQQMLHFDQRFAAHTEWTCGVNARGHGPSEAAGY